jgi:DNA-binding response OmpR family regulator
MIAPAGGTLTILVVEDDVSVGELVREVLNDVPGWGATLVHDAAAAQAVFQHVQVELMVLDLNLPGISGLQLLELLQRHPEWCAPPVILMSAAPSQTGVQEALERGTACQIIAQPFDVDHLVDAVRSAALEHR